MSPVRAVTPLVHGAGRTILPAITEETARRQVTNAKRALTRAENRLEDTPSGYSIWTRKGPSDEWLAAEAAVKNAERRLEAAVNRLDAVRSQQPDRRIGGWTA